MRSLTSWKKYRSEQVVTVSWMEDGLDLVVWESHLRDRRNIRGSAHLSVSECTPEAYRKVLSSLLKTSPHKRTRVYWILLQEAFPPILPQEHQLGDYPIKLPDWIRWCWQSLTPAELPRSVISGMAAMGEELNTWAEFEEPGSGYCLSLHGYTLFVGHGNQCPVRRVSRRPLIVGRGTEPIGDEWLLQTRALFKSRTGMELKRVYVEESRSFEASWIGDVPFEIRPSRKPMAINGIKRHDVNPSLAFLHASAFRFRESRGCQLNFRSLYRRKQAYCWERRLRIVAGLLFCGWGFMFLNACRHEVLLPDSPSDNNRIDTARKQLLEKEKRWEKWHRYTLNRDAPLHLVGIVAESVPKSVEVNKLHMQRPSGDSPDNLQFELEGIYNGSAPSAAFREWISALRELRAIDEVENLQFRRQTDGIAFTFAGRTRIEDGW